jgi:MFS family permease
MGRSSHYRWYVVGMLWCISFFNYADRQAIFSVFPLLQKEPFFLTETERGMLASAFAVVYGLTAPLAGGIVDRVRRRTAILGGLQAWSIICAATALSTKFWHLLAFRAAEGLGETFYYPASMSLLSDYHGRETRSRALGLHQTSVYAGTIAGGFFAGLISEYYGWRSSFIVFGALGMLLGVALHVFLIEPVRGASEEAPRPALSQAGPFSGKQTMLLILSRPVVLCLMLAFVCANAGALVLLSWMPQFLHDRFEFGLAVAGLNATLYPQLASVLGAVIGGWLADRWRRRSSAGRILAQVAGSACVAPFVLLCSFGQSLTLVLAGLAGWGLFKGVYDANIFASVFDFVEPHHRGSVAGFMNMFGWLGAALAPVTVGVISEHYGLATGIGWCAVAYIAATAFLLVAASLGRRSQRLAPTS